MKRIVLFFFLIVSLFFQGVFWYTLTQQDFEKLDVFELELMDFIDEPKNNFGPYEVLDYIAYLQETRELTEKQEVLLEVVADDISYYYYLWEYADDLVYEMLPEDCYDDEYYDSEEKWCYFKDENYIDDNQDYLSSDYHVHGEEAASEIRASYLISWDKITLESGVNGVKDTELWNIFTTLIPLSARWDFKMYQIVDDANSDTWAYVEQDSENNNKWNMTVNVDAFYTDGVLDESYVYETLIHEFAHVLTLAPSQVHYYPQTESELLLERFAQNCQTNLLWEGCLYETAYLDDFIDTFWTDSEYLEKVRNGEINAYTWNEENFVTDYAATNPGEDIAESFTRFVLKNKDNGWKIASEKINFFYDYEVLVLLRKQIRSRLSTFE